MEKNIFKKIEENSKKIFIIILVTTIIIGAIFLFLHLRSEVKEIIPEVKEELPTNEPVVEEIVVKERVEGWMVDVKGEVNKPGTYAVYDNMRINDVIELAGGITNNADTSLTNLSKKITDQMVIIIYSKQEVKEIIARKITQSGILECSPNEIILNGKCTTEEVKKEEVTTKININTATISELTTITGIGESKANNIIEYRTTNKFTTIEDIKNVPGIGESLFETIKEFITV